MKYFRAMGRVWGNFRYFTNGNLEGYNKEPFGINRRKIGVGRKITAVGKSVRPGCLIAERELSKI